MFTIDELLSKRNQREAMAHFETKRNSRGADGMMVSELPNYWQLNHERIEQEIRTGTYEPSVIKTYENVNGKGKKRIVSNLAVIDRFITRLLSQKLKRYIEPEFLANSFAYQDGKGILDAVMLAQKYMEQGNLLVIEIDLKDYFDTIPIEAMMVLLEKRISDTAVLQLIRKYLYCKIEMDNHIEDKCLGLVQGNSISPILSNMYLHSVDSYLEEQGLCWMRFADNLYIFMQERQAAVEVYNTVCEKLRKELHLQINSKKSGIHNAIERQILGYEFYKRKGKIEVRKHVYQKVENYHNWHACAVQKINHEYHILQDGVLNKKDYALLFENDKEKHHIPVEVIDHMNLYGEVTITSNVLKTISEKNIRLAFLDKYGNLEGYFIPKGYPGASFGVLKQCSLYNDVAGRLQMAKQMEMAGIHNMRANLRYYHKKNNNPALIVMIDELTRFIELTNEGKTLDELLLIEARARQKYYSGFNLLLNSKEFVFTKRTRQPPEDPINALISFGNTLLYNQFLQIIWKSKLDPRIGIVHAANNRSHSLNLDFADIFKPIIVDRVIFSLINMQQIKAGEDFEKSAKGGIYLSKTGKKIFIEQFEKKLLGSVTIKGKNYTYKRLMENEIIQFQKYILSGEKYKPYKYY